MFDREAVFIQRKLVSPRGPPCIARGFEQRPSPWHHAKGTRRLRPNTSQRVWGAVPASSAPTWPDSCVGAFSCLRVRRSRCWTPCPTSRWSWSTSPRRWGCGSALACAGSRRRRAKAGNSWWPQPSVVSSAGSSSVCSSLARLLQRAPLASCLTPWRPPAPRTHPAQDAAEFVAGAPANVAASVTPQHMLLNRNALFVKGLRPHNYCLPILKREKHSEEGTCEGLFFVSPEAARCPSRTPQS